MYLMMSEFLHALVLECTLTVGRFDWLPRVGGKPQTSLAVERVTATYRGGFAFWIVVVPADCSGE